MSADQGGGNGHPAGVPKQDLLGFVSFSFYLSMWVHAQFVPLLAIYLWWRRSSYVLLVILGVYHVYRRYNTPLPWTAIHRATADFVHKHPYFRTQQLILDIDELPKPNSRALFSYHMHGVLTCGSLLNGVCHPLVMKADPRCLVGSGLFDIAFMKDLLLWYKFLPWTREVMKEEMKKSTNLIVMPGGFEEASIYKRNAHRTYIKERKGWVKYALQNGYQIYPCYTFGEELTYWSWTGLMKYRLMANKYQLPGVAFLGKWCSWLPANDVDLITVIGAPLELPTIAHPSAEEISKYHSMYMDVLRALFDKHKKAYCVNPDAVLEFVGPTDFGLKA